MKSKHLYYIAFIALIFPAIFMLNSCKKDDDDNKVEVFYSKVILKFDHKIDGDTARFNIMKYVNAYGNQYEISNVQWFISDLTFYKSGKAPFIVSKTTKSHYIDTGIPTSQTWEVTDDIPEGIYDSMSFIFGFTPEENISFMFVNYPENAMDWPSDKGGGYHYMKLNGFWKDTVNFRRAFNFHIGIGRVINGSDTTFVPNYFKFSYNSPITISADKKKEITVAMNIDEWFKTPHIWNFDYWGSAIMDNQNAMRTAKENGQIGVFTITSVKDL